MNKEQIASLVRQAVMAITALVISYSWLPEGAVSLIAPALVAVGLWWISPSKSLPSALRKVLGLIAPVIHYYGLANASQTTAIILVALTFTSIWTSAEKQTSNQK